jgi:hypothetical protein
MEIFERPSGRSFYLSALASLFASLSKPSVMNGIAISKQVAIRAAIKPYSIAVAPQSFLKKASIRSLLSPHCPHLQPGQRHSMKCIVEKLTVSEAQTEDWTRLGKGFTSVGS